MKLLPGEVATQVELGEPLLVNVVPAVGAGSLFPTSGTMTLLVTLRVVVVPLTVLDVGLPLVVISVVS
ncbi:MAG: hypothetical protein BGO63_02105 [Candidatus Accumulibacter sp. 66-26]|nr:MAG: hypothetical protein BGO63_02105 [Candidatus Accumulibacter sp. 66-26]